MRAFRFPDERRSVRAAKRAIQPELEFAARVWKVWSVIFDRDWGGNGVDVSEVLACKLLTTQLWRQFRSLCISCESGDAMVAETISRSIYDTTLALAFVIADEIRLYPRLQLDKQGRRRVGGDGRHKFVAARRDARDRRARVLTARMRGLLVMAFMELQDEAYVRKKSLEGVVPEHVKAVSSAIHKAKRLTKNMRLRSWSEAIPTGWRRVLEQSNSYSGLNTREMARMIGGTYETYYHTLYHFHSRSVHSVSTGELLDMVGERVTLRWYSRAEDIRFALETGLSQLLNVLIDVTIRFDIGAGYVKELEQLDREYGELLRRKLNRRPCDSLNSLPRR